MVLICKVLFNAFSYAFLNIWSYILHFQHKFNPSRRNFPCSFHCWMFSLLLLRLIRIIFCCLLILFYTPLLLSSIYLADVRTFAAVVICDCPVDRLPLHPRINRSYQATHSRAFKSYIYFAYYIFQTTMDGSSLDWEIFDHNRKEFCQNWTMPRVAICHWTVLSIFTFLHLHLQPLQKNKNHIVEIVLSDML